MLGKMLGFVCVVIAFLTMSEEAKPAKRAGPIRTAPLDDSGKLRDALQNQLRQVAAPSLLVISGPDVGLRVRLHRAMDVGRDPTCAFALRDENVSWRHVHVEDRGSGDWALVDLSSTNGTLVNGDKVSDVLLKNGDKIVIGKTILEFQIADALREGFNTELERLLHEDELSGLWVKRRFDAQLQTVCAAVAAGSMPVVSVVVMDLDGVKAINDTHGHDMGAFVIGEAGHVLRDRLVDVGFGTRFGGDEYAAAFPETTKARAVELAEELRRAVVDHVYERGGVRVHPGMSCGVAAVPEDATEAEGVFRAADQAMYRAKRAGKNRVAT
jgi:diguanylate cyclase (GGDEF)-like protein